MVNRGGYRNVVGQGGAFRLPEVTWKGRRPDLALLVGPKLKQMTS